MQINRRQLIGTSMAATALSVLPGCSTRPFGTKASYLTPILNAQNQNTVFHWLDIIMQQTRDQRVPPPRAAYNFGMPLVAGFLAANGIAQRYSEPYGIGPAPQGADPEVAYGVAFATAASEVFQQPFLSERRAFKNRFPDGEAKSLGIEWGRKVGLHIVKMRTNDGSQPHRVGYYLDHYKRRKDMLKWTPTNSTYSAAPGPHVSSFDRGLFPGHGMIKPWTMKSGSQFRSPDFYDPASPEFAKDYDMIRHLGGADSKIRTADQSEIALFWEDGPWGITPPGHFLLIAIQVLQNKGMDFIDTARAFALLGATQTDASINAWDNKYHHDVLRPETAICFRADKFRNADNRVKCQDGWRSYIPTPPFPAYTSGHSTFGAVGVEMTALLLGSRRVNFSHESPDQVLWPKLKGKRRHFTSLDQAADENGLSRLYGGVHWQKDHDEAMTAGKAIARHAFQNMFQKRV